MLIHVTEADGREGLRNHAVRCQVAIALKRQTGRRWVVVPGTEALSAAAISGDVRVALPSEVAGHIKSFDKKGWVEEFSFEFNWSATNE